MPPKPKNATEKVLNSPKNATESKFYKIAKMAIRTLIKCY